MAPSAQTTLEILHDAGPDANLNSLNLGSTGSLPSTTAVNITASGATLDLNGINQTIGSLSGVAGSSVLLGSGMLTLGGNGTSTTFSGNISGTRRHNQDWRRHIHDCRRKYLRRHDLDQQWRFKRRRG